MQPIKSIALLLLISVFSVSAIKAADRADSSVKTVMNRVITDLYKTTGQDDLAKIDTKRVMSLFTRDELQVLAEKHWTFDTDVPVMVSLMISTEQKTQPFWLIESGFKKTSLTMKNRQTTYAVWQKTFPAGKVGLGVNGFEDGLALHYFVSVAPVQKGTRPKLSNFYPAKQVTGSLKNGASTYQDWDELVLEEVPESMQGEILLTTTRGRASESHLVGAFRSTSYPSSKVPDQVVLTWSASPSNSMDIQWRTSLPAGDSVITYREKNSSNVYSILAEKQVMEDRMLMNDRYSNHFTARLRNLKPGITYQYRMGRQNDWSDQLTFSTASKDESFSFLWFGDTHFSPRFGEILQKGWSAHPDASFFSVVGDLVSDGLNRNQWDALFDYSKEVSCHVPFMAVPGNHDNRAGLGARMFCDLFSYPMNGPDGVPKEQTYSFTYKNTLFLMIDATSPIDAQTAWIDKQLSATKAKWKIAMFHFPPYNWEEPYLDIQKAWVPLFDKYHVDMVFGGHIHYYMRSDPMKGGHVVSSYKDGTAYIISVGIPNSDHPMTEEPYARVRNGAGHLYQYVRIDGQKIYFESVNAKGTLIDSFTMTK